MLEVKVDPIHYDVVYKGMGFIFPDSEKDTGKKVAKIWRIVEIIAKGLK